MQFLPSLPSRLLISYIKHPLLSHSTDKTHITLNMGLLQLGTALDWPDAKKNADQVRNWGIKQLLEIWNKAKTKERDALLWGDEVEYLVVSYDKEKPKVLLSLRQADILEALANDSTLAADRKSVV